MTHRAIMPHLFAISEIRCRIVESSMRIKHNGFCVRLLNRAESGFGREFHGISCSIGRSWSAMNQTQCPFVVQKVSL